MVRFIGWWRWPLNRAASGSTTRPAWPGWLARSTSSSALIRLGGRDVTQAVRTESLGEAASRVAALPAVRQALLALQRAFATAPGLVADGRDMGSVVFPAASLKLFLTASPEERARRRHKQLKDKGIDVSLRGLSRDIERRDQRDQNRPVAPLKPAENARVVDSTRLSPQQVVELALAWLAEAGIAGEAS